MIGLHYGWYLGMVFSFLPIWKGLLFVVLSQAGSLGTTCCCGQAQSRCWRLAVHGSSCTLPNRSMQT